MPNQLKPTSVRLETATVCQLRCPSCSTTQGKIKRAFGAGFLKLEDFRKFIDGNPWVSHIELSNWGEIFLNPDFTRILKCAQENNVALTAHNGANLNSVKDDVLDALVRYRFRDLTCSIDGASAKSYRIYRKKGDFKTVINNIKKINHCKARRNSIYPRLAWQFIVFGHNEHEIPIARKMARELNMSIRFKLSWDESFSPIRDVDFVKKHSGLSMVSRREHLEKSGTAYMSDICTQLWNEPQINWDGKILGCCVNRWGDFGTLPEWRLSKGLNNDKMRYAKKMLMGKSVPRDDIPCTKCHHYRARSETNDWLTMERIKESPHGQ